MEEEGKIRKENVGIERTRISAFVKTNLLSLQPDHQLFAGPINFLKIVHVGKNK